MPEIRYLSLADVMALHYAMMERFGAPSAPLRDEGALESALMRARMAAYYDDADIVRQSALLAVGISQARAFLDGNKRIAFAVCDVFLRVNGLAFSGDPLELALQFEALAKREDSLDRATGRFEQWLRKNVSPRGER
ncbi:MAG TPA: type II toxin-antitoxin system death-on-curing family toxin [Ktedonobacteraceae bacterium]|nr:type II toxin-antitoxin system death-on-curing family toxin [Ktedonobacteraceae bacterium]